MINAALEAETGKPLADEVITRALEHVTFSFDPHADTFETLVANGLAAGTQKEGSIDGLFDLRLLNGLLEASGAEPSRLRGSERNSRELRPLARPPVRVVDRRAAPGGRAPSPLGPSFDSVMPVRQPAPTVEPAVRIEHVGKRFGDGPARARRHHPRHRARRVRVPARCLGLRQVDSAQPHRGTRPADGRAASRRRRPARP